MLLEKLQYRKNKGRLIAEIQRYIREGKSLTETTKKILASPSFRLYADTVIKGKKDPITKDYFTDEEYDIIKKQIKNAFEFTPKQIEELQDKLERKKEYHLNWANSLGLDPKALEKEINEINEMQIRLPEAYNFNKDISKDSNTINIYHDNKGPMYKVLGRSTLKIPHKESYDSATIELYDEYDFNSIYGGKESFLEQGKNILKDAFSGNFSSIYPAAMQLAEKYGAHVLPDEATAKRKGVEAEHVPVSIKVPVSEIMDEETWNKYQSSITYKKPQLFNMDYGKDKKTKKYIKPQQFKSKLQFRKGGLNRKQYTNG